VTAGAPDDPARASAAAGPLTIDDLARKVELPVRTIREYHTMRLLPPPERRGRVGLYGAAHVQRLQLIARLQRRGYSLAGIRDLLGAWENGTELAALLGVDEGHAALDETPRLLTRAELLAAPQLQVIPVWRSQCLIRAGQPARLAGGTAAAACAAAGSQVFLGLAGAVPLFAADLSALDRAAALRIAAADDSADVRSVIGAVSQDEAGLHAYARGILGWHARQQFCGSCGGRTESRDGGHARGQLLCGGR